MEEERQEEQLQRDVVERICSCRRGVSEEIITGLP
jgi:hypothetical protein